MKADWVGWLATATFAISYVVHHPVAMRRIQSVAALLWLTYGVMIHALPVIVANLIVAVAALWSSVHAKRTSATVERRTMERREVTPARPAH